MNILVPNKQELTRKISHIKACGPSTFHVVTDFDQTLTRRLVGGKKPPSVYAEINKYLGKEYDEKERKLFDTYYPYEINSNASMEVRCQKMIEWWQLHLQLLIEHGLDKKTLGMIAKHREFLFRDGIGELFALLAKNNIPLLILSAGLGDVITDVLQLQGMLTPNVHVISNVFDFDESGKVKGYKNHIIHSFNKSEVEIKHHLYHKQIEQRKNVLLLGDLVEDCGMTAGIHHDCIIRVGFLNENVEERRDEYSKAFDVVVLNDGTMAAVVGLMREIVEGK